jgi:nucleotide-binding universal stress UspA family protein
VRYLFGKVPVTAGLGGLSLAMPTPGTMARLPGTEANEMELSRPHVLVATRGAPKLLTFAANYCRKTNAIMFVLFVRQVNVTLTGNVSAPDVNEDDEAIKAFQVAADICQKHGVQTIPIYAVSSDVSYTILDFAATYGVESVLMGVSREAALLRALRGDVITSVADNLPEDISLLVHA